MFCRAARPQRPLSDPGTMANSVVNRDVSAHAPDSQGRRPTASRRLVHDPPHPALRPSTPSPLVAREACGLRVPHVSRAGTLQPLLLAEPPTRLPSTLQRANGGSVKTQGDHARPLFKAPSLTRKKQSPSSCRVLQGPAGLTRPELPGHLLPTRWPCGPLCGPHLPHTTLRKRKTIFGL